MKKFIFSKVVGIFSKFKGIFQGFYLDFKNAALSPQCIDLSSFHQTLKPPPPLMERVHPPPLFLTPVRNPATP